VVERETPAHGDKTDPNFQYGTTQAYVALVILVGEASAFSIQIFLISPFKQLEAGEFAKKY
jgi:hypothetical protein